MDSYMHLADLLKNSFIPIATLQSQSIKSSLEETSQVFSNYCRILSSLYSSEQFIESATRLSDLSKLLYSAIERSGLSPDSLDFLKDLDLQNGYIELTENDCNSINTILESSNASESSPKITKGKTTLAEFIKTVFIPILTVLVPILLTIYYHKIDSIESQKHHIEELQLKEEELRIEKQQLQNDIEQTETLKKILIEIQNFPDFFESLQVDLECLSEVSVPSGEVPEPLDEVPNCSDAIADESGNQ